jgi:hypothetical protein
VVGVRPVLQVGVWKVRVHAPGCPWMHQRPRACQPVAGGAALGRCGVGADLDQVLDQEAFAAVGEGGGVGARVVVGAAPRQEVHLPHPARVGTKRGWFGIGARNARIQMAVRIDQAATPTTSTSGPGTQRGCRGTSAKVETISTATSSTIAPNAAPSRLRRAMIRSRLMDTATNSNPPSAAEAPASARNNSLQPSVVYPFTGVSVGSVRLACSNSPPPLSSDAVPSQAGVAIRRRQYNPANQGCTTASSALGVSSRCRWSSGRIEHHPLPQARRQAAARPSGRLRATAALLFMGVAPVWLMDPLMSNFVRI